MGIDFVTPRIHQASPPQGAASIVACSRESARGSEQCWAKLFPGCAGLPAVLFEIHPGNGAGRKEGEINFWNMVDKLVVCWPAICQLRSSISKGTTQISDARRQEFFRHCSAPMAFDPVKGRYLKVDSVTNSCPRTLGVNRSGRCYFKKLALCLFVLKSRSVRYAVAFWNSQSMARDLKFWIRVGISVGLWIQVAGSPGFFEAGMI